MLAREKKNPPSPRAAGPLQTDFIRNLSLNFLIWPLKVKPLKTKTGEIKFWGGNALPQL